MTRITDERLAEMVGAGVPCVPAQPGEIAAVVQELRASRHQEPVEPAEWQRQAIEHIDTLHRLLLIIKEHWIDYDHVFSISVHGAEMFLGGQGPLPSFSTEEDADYLVWSNEHRAWWRENSCGYARSILEAGRYTRAEAVDIADKSRNGWKLDQRPDEIAVAIADLPSPIRAALMSPKETGQ